MHSYDKASWRHIIKKPCLKLQQLEATLQQLLMNSRQCKRDRGIERGGRVQKYALLGHGQRRERVREGGRGAGAKTNYAQDKQHADSSSNSNSNCCCCNLLLIYVEIKNELSERDGKTASERDGETASNAGAQRINK